MENELLTRIQLKYDTLSNWLNSSFILKRGEVAVAEIPSVNTLNGQSNLTSPPDFTPPVVGIKIGDGLHDFARLPWLQAVAGDVYEWAKSPTVPSATQIPGLAEFVAMYGGGGGSGSGGSGLQYRIVQGSGNDANKYFLECKAISGSTWSEAATSQAVDLTSYDTRLDQLEDWANGGVSAENIDYPLSITISNVVAQRVGLLDASDSPVAHKFVTAVSEENGLITVYRRAVDAEDIETGTLPLARGGLGMSNVPSGEVLVGNGTGALNTRPISDDMDEGLDTDIVTKGAVQTYIQLHFANLTGAMRFVGEANNLYVIEPNSTTDPHIANYSFANAHAGDVIIQGHKEFVWDGEKWLLLGDEGSYVVSGSIRNADIAVNAAIAISKIAGLQDALDSKVDKVTGKQLSTNDFTNDYKNKLDGIEANAQENIIENVTIGNATSTYNPLTKTLAFDLDLSNVGRVQGATIPNTTHTDVEDVTLVNNKIPLERIATSGDVKDLRQSDTFLVLNCGTSTTVI